MSFSINAYRPEDKQSLLQIFRRNIPAYFAPHEQWEFSDYLEREGSTYFTLRDDGRIIGGVGTHFDPISRKASITWIFLHPDAKGKGFAAHAVRHCLRLLLQHSVAVIEVRTSQFASRFFEQMGFSLVHAEKDYWSPGLDLYQMQAQPEAFRDLTMKTNTTPFALSAIPTLRIYDYDTAVAFYCSRLQFRIDWEHRFGPDAPVYMQVSGYGARLHLSASERFSAGAIVFMETSGLEVLRNSLKLAKLAEPEQTAWGTIQIELEDPFGNLLRFNEQAERAATPDSTP